MYIQSTAKISTYTDNVTGNILLSIGLSVLQKSWVF